MRLMKHFTFVFEKNGNKDLYFCFSLGDCKKSVFWSVDLQTFDFLFVFSAFREDTGYLLRHSAT